MVEILPPNLTAYQKAIVLSEKRFTVTIASPKSGKAQPIDTIVYTPNGTKKIGELKIGDEILTPFGKSEVDGIFPQGIKKVYSIEFNDRKKTECCGEHLWDIKNQRQGKWKTISLQEIIQIGKGELRRYRIPSQGVVEFNALPVPINPYLLGILIGDGSLSAPGVIISCNDEEILNKISKVLPKKHRIVHRSKYDYGIAIERNATQEAYDKKTLSYQLRKLGLKGTRSHEKFVPDIYKYNSIEVRMELIRGLMDSDGFVDRKGQARIEQTSKQLADDITELIESIGGYVKQKYKPINFYKKDGEKIMCKPVYRQGIMYHDCARLFSLARKRNKCLLKKKPMNRNIKSISEVGEKDCVCIKIKDSRGLYLTNNFIVTHNTFSHICWIFGAAHQKQEKKGANYWWVAPVYNQTEIAFFRMQRFLFGHKEYSFNESKLTIKTPMDTIIHFKSAEKPDNLFGEDVYGAVFDEFTRARPAAWVALRTTLSSTNGKCKLIGNYLGMANWGHHFIEGVKDNPDYEIHRITINQAVSEGILKQDEIDSIKNDPQMTPGIFDMLYNLKDGESEDQLIRNEAITNLWTNDFVPGGQKFMTCDIALHGSDKFVVAVWDGYRLIHLAVIPKSDGKEVYEKILSIRTNFQVPYSNIIYDADGVGGFLKGYLPHAKAFNNNGTPVKEAHQKMEYKNLKSQCYFKLAQRINEGQIYIACDVPKAELCEELKCVKNATIDKDGKLAVIPKEKVKEIIGRSPDLSDAFMMRCYFDITVREKVFASG